MQLTLEERERLAYIEGRTEEAKLLAQLDDAERRIYDEAHEAGYISGYEDCLRKVPV